MAGVAVAIPGVEGVDSGEKKSADNDADKKNNNSNVVKSETKVKVENDLENDLENAETGLIDGDPDDLSTWTKLLKSAKEEGDIVKKRQYYETFLRHFPLSGKHWIEYMDIESKAGNYAQVENILKRTMLSCCSMELWEYYL
eukprot:CAMPEP_0204840936 /NCGR_PEP_ID=MMETSP1346-20131115/39642_1 /ASSEMBLY_ACC=CAM_ASM_000771 /TAXON_ID=215587 /ORGANISM="Aplanochytrium stocchinoi, Strain GSBS06" /LENGTH=141 /DNA_ID=CAMNT_0051978655 /DNA_START=463 /DNA_END=885 /DNA_ORIENTATION=-